MAMHLFIHLPRVEGEKVMRWGGGGGEAGGRNVVETTATWEVAEDRWSLELNWYLQSR